MKVFPPFRLDTVNQCLWREDERVALTPKAFDVLRFLVEHAGRLVTHDEILEALWPETYVNPEGIRKYVLEIRKVLGDPSTEPLFIQTLPKRGYQFIAKVTGEQTPTRSASIIEPSENIVGREAAFSQLDGLLEKAVRGRRQVIFITGEAGIGKTTLVDAFQHHASRISNLRLARGQCIEGFGDKEAYYPMLEAIASLLRGAADDSLVQALERQAPTWLAQFPFAVKLEQREWLRQEVLGSTQGRMVREICEVLDAMTAETPLLLILEDLHWADSSTLDLISVLARRRDPARLLLIGTYRPVDVVLSQSPLKAIKQDLTVRNLCHEIAIERLEESHVAEYLANEFAFADSSLPAGLAKVIHRHSGGNALFMVGIVRDMVNRGLIARNHGEWALTASVEDIDPGIPETLQQMVDIQFDRMSAEEKRVLQCSSVSGERFPVWAAAVLTGSSSATAEEICEKLARREQFIRFAGIHQAADGSDSLCYEFLHALYRQALYRGLSEPIRAGFHLRLGRQLMASYAAGKHELASEVALHFEKGRDYEQAACCLIVAAENASRRLALGDAIKILRRALELIPLIRGDARIELEIQALHRTGDFHYAFGAMSDSVAAYEIAAVRAREAGLVEAHVAALTAMGFPGFFIDTVKGEKICDLAMQASRELSDPVLRAKTELAVACFRLLYGSWTAEDVEVCTLARKAIDASNDALSLPHVHHIYVQALQGQYAEAARQADILINLGVEPACTLASGGKGLVYISTGAFGDMLRMVRRGQELSAKNETPGWIWILGESWIRLLCFDLEGARSLENITMPSDAEPHAIWLKMVARICTGYLEIAMNNYETALAAFGALRDFEITAKSFLHWHWRIQAQVGTVEAHLSAGDLSSANQEAADLLESALTLADPNLRALAWEINARVSAAQENWLKAREHIDHALAVLDKFEIPPSGWRVHRTARTICQAEGDGVMAARHGARAQEMIVTIAGSFDPDEPLRKCFLSAPAVRSVLEQSGSPLKQGAAARSSVADES
jgi:DNA-binding winged helix-turn-helix (wHTH) protein/tetratricopeptide (TPR) repeat protein